MVKKSSHLIEDIQKKIDIAQEAASRMSDSSLKVIAFQTVLQRLLVSDEAPTSEKEAEGKPRSEKTPKEQKTKQPKGAKGRIEELITEGFFSQKRTIGEVKQELDNHAWFHRVEALNPALQRLVTQKKLRRIKEPENEGGKLVWRYSNW